MSLSLADVRRELFSVLHLRTGKAAPSAPSLEDTGRRSLAAFNTLPHSPHCLPEASPLLPDFLPYNFLHTPDCSLSSLPLSLSPSVCLLCLSLLTHAASQLMVPDSCYVQSEPSRADAGRRGASEGEGTGTLVEG